MLTIDDPGYFERLARVERDHWWARSMWRIASGWLAPAIRGRRGLAALDVGCGAGLTLARLAERPEIGSVVGVEPSPDALRLARGRGPYPLARGSVLNLPFAPASFDVVTCFDVVQHLPDGTDRPALGEIRRVLRPGGVVVVRSNAAGRPGRTRGGSAYRLGELTEVVGSAGLRVERASYVNCLPALVQEARGRWSRWHNARRGGGERSAWLAHPGGGGLRIDVPAPAVNAMMTRVARAEEWATVRLGRALPFGHGTMVLAMHPEPAQGMNS